MYYRWICSIIMVFLLGLTGCGASDEAVIISTAVATTPTPIASVAPTPTHGKTAIETTADSIRNVCLVTQSDGVENNFNRLIYEGVQAVATDYDLESTYFVTKDDNVSVYTKAIEECITSDADVIVLGLNPDSEATAAFARAHPERRFVGVEFPIANGPPNHTAIIFRSDQGGFIAGYLAGLITVSNTVAGIYGPDYPPLKAFRHGFEQGVAFAAHETEKEITVLGEYLDSFDNPDSGAASARAFIAQGADVIFGAAGITGSAGILAAAQEGVYVIGVDQDEYLTTFQGGKVEGSKYIVSSALKRVDIGVRETLAALIEEGDFAAGSIYLMGVAEGAIGFAGRHEAEVPEEIYNQVADIQGQLAEGNITTGVDPETGELLEKHP